MSKQLADNNHELNEILWNLYEDSLFIVDREGTLLDFNDSAFNNIESELNIALEKGRNAYEIVQAVDKGLSEETFLTFIKSEDSISFSFDVNPNFYVEITVQNISYAGSSCKLIKIKDISDKQFELTGQKFYAKMLNQASDAIIVTSSDLSDLKTLYVNKAYEQITGYTFAEVRGKNPNILQGPKTEKKVIDRLKENLAKGEDFFGQTINYRKSGEEFINEWHITPLRDGEDVVIYYMAIIRDVTDREGMKKKLEQNDKQLRAIFENMSEGLVIHNKNGTIVDHNQAAEKVLGLTGEQLTGRDSFHPDWKTIHADGTLCPGEEHPSSKSLATGKVVNKKVIGVNRSSGEIRWLHVNSRPLFDENDSISGALATFQDITEEFVATRKLEHSEKKYRTLFNDNPNPIFITKPESGKIVSANNAAEKLYEFSKKELLTKTLKGFEALDSSKNDFESDDIVHLTKQKLIYVNDHTKKIEIEGEPSEIHLIHDITSRKLTEHKLEKSERQIRAMASNSPSAVFVTDDKGRCTMLYGTLFDKLELEEEHLIGLTLSEFSEQFNFELISTTQSDTKNSEELAVFKWGEYYLRTIRTKQFDNQGNYAGKIGITVDITDQYKVKLELEQTARELKLGQRIAKIGTWRFDVKTQELSWSQMTYEIHEVNDEFKPEVSTAIGFYKKDDVQIINEAFNNLIDNNVPYDLTLRIITAKGNEKWVRTMADAILEEGKITEVYGTLQDISDQKELKDHRLRLENIVKHTTNEIYIFDAKTLDLTYMNDSAFNNLGYDQDKLPKLSIADILDEFDKQRFKNEVLHPLAKGQRKGKSIQFQHKRKNGTTYDVETTVQYMTINYDEVIVLVANDVTIKHRDKKRRNLINTVNEIIVNSKEKDQSLDEIIAVISDMLQLDGGEFWQYTDNNTFRQSNKWSSNQELLKFLDVSQDLEIPENKGVFTELINGREIIVLKKIYKKHFPQITRVNHSLISCAVAFRVETKENLYGMMLFYRKQCNNDIYNFLNTLSIVSNQVAQFLQNQNITNQLIRSAEEKEILLREIHHRVKNNLQTVSSLLYLKSFEIEDEDLSSFFVDTQNRISAISFTHEKLLKANQFRVLDIKTYLEDLILNIYNTYETNNSNVEIVTDLLEIDLPTDIVMNLGLIINELLTNSLQHAFDNRDDCKVFISFKKKSQGYELLVEDNGQGLDHVPRKNTIGLQLVDIFVSQLKANMQRESKNGLKYKIKLKLNGL